MQRQPVNQVANNQIEKQLSDQDTQLKLILRDFQSLYGKLSFNAKHCFDNSQNVISILIKIISISFKPLELTLRFLEDCDILAIASTCQALYRLIYSPLGYRIMNHLRPVVAICIKQPALKIFNKSTIEYLKYDPSLLGLDDEDKWAMIQTMKSNLKITKQTIRELEMSNLQYEKKKKIKLEELSFTFGQKEQQLKNIEHLRDQIEKMHELLKQSEENLKRLKEEQDKLVFERENKIVIMETEKSKLRGHKELLIKKIKSQQKEKEQGLIYAREVARAITMLNKLTGSKK